MEQSIYIPITTDYGFKATFGNESHPLFLKKALQALIKSEIPIKEINYVKNAFEGLTIDSRSGIYDVACTDERGNHFIVEMQLGHSPHFVQRMKFYALHKFNILVKKGQFNYANLPKIYCVALLRNNILPYADYHTIVNLRNEKGELIDNQMMFILVELGKFDKQDKEINSDLDKLLWIMKNLHTNPSPTLPFFVNEDWLKQAIEELDTRKMTVEERYAYEYAVSANAEVINAEKRKIANLLALNVLTVEQIANSLDVSNDFVLDVQRNLLVS